MTRLTPPEKQKIASIARQVGTLIVAAYGILSIKEVVPHLPAWCEAIMVASFPAIQILEHWLGDPSTGTAASKRAAELDVLVAQATKVWRELAQAPAVGVDQVPHVTVVVPIDPSTGQPHVATAAPPAPTPQGA